MNRPRAHPGRPAPAFENGRRQRHAAEGFCGLLELLDAFDGLDVHAVGPSLYIELGPAQRLIEPERSGRAVAGNDERFRTKTSSRRCAN